jgi:hypothetical protein
LFDEISAEATSECLHGVDRGMDDWDHERAQDEDPVADEEPHEFDIHGITVEAGYHYAYGLLPSVLLRLCVGVTSRRTASVFCPSVLLTLCAGVTKPADASVGGCSCGPPTLPVSWRSTARP